MFCPIAFMQHVSAEVITRSSCEKPDLLHNDKAMDYCFGTFVFELIPWPGATDFLNTTSQARAKDFIKMNSCLEGV